MTKPSNSSSIPETRIKELLREHSIPRTAEMLGVPYSTLNYFLHRHPELRPVTYRRLRKSKLDPYREAIVLSLSKTHSITMTAKELDIPYAGLRSYLKTHPELNPPGLEKREPPHWDHIPDKKITELLKTHTIKHTAKLLGVPYRPFYFYLKDRPELFPPEWEKGPVRATLFVDRGEEITRLLAETKNLTETAERLGTCVSNFSRYIEKHPELVPEEYKLRGWRILDTIPGRKITRLLQGGETLQEVAWKLGVTRIDLNVYLKKHPELRPISNKKPRRARRWKSRGKRSAPS